MRITLIALGLVSLSCSSEKGLTVYNQAPSVTIFDPFDDEVFDEGEVVGFSARIGDDQDPVDSLVRVWRSDRHDLGGAELSLSADGIATMTTGVLGLGAHTISLTVIASLDDTTVHRDQMHIVVAEGDNLVVPLSVSLEELLSDTVRNVSVVTRLRCPQCGGTGASKGVPSTTGRLSHAFDVICPYRSTELILELSQVAARARRSAARTTGYSSSPTTATKLPSRISVIRSTSRRATTSAPIDTSRARILGGRTHRA